MKAINSHAQFVYPVKWGEILGINLKKQEKVPRAQDGCPLNNVEHDAENGPHPTIWCGLSCMVLSGSTSTLNFYDTISPQPHVQTNEHNQKVTCL
jgi:hypothetical protein